MKILFFADSHLGFDYPIRPRIHRRRRGDDFFENYHHILETAVREEVDVLLHGGDVFFRSKIPKQIIQKVYEPLLAVLDRGIDLILVPGNHERSRLPTTPLFHHPKLHLFDRPRTFTFEKEDTRVAFGGFPNIRNHVAGNFATALAATGIIDQGAHVKLLCLHQSIENAVVGVQNFRFRKGDDVIGLNQFPAGLDLILSGHIHRHQALMSHQGTPVIYPGSIERISFAERLETKGYVMIDINGDDIKWEFRPLPTRPMIEWNLSQDLNDEQAIMAHIQSKVSGLPENAIVKVRCATPDQASKLKVATLRELLPQTCNVDIVFPSQDYPSQRTPLS